MFDCKIYPRHSSLSRIFIQETASLSAKTWRVHIVDIHAQYFSWPLFEIEIVAESFLAMESDDRKNLYLLEVMVKNVEIDADVLLECFTFNPDRVRLIDVKTIVNFSNHFILNIDCLASVYRGSSEKKPIKCESCTTLDFERNPLLNPTIGQSEENVASQVQAGKSCLFPMSAERLMSELECCPLYIQVFSRDDDSDKVKCNDKGTADIFLGKAKLDLSAENFADVVASAEVCVDLPISAFLRLYRNHTGSTLPIKTVFGNVSGQVLLYVRLSCFGKSILSGFTFLQQKNEPRKGKDEAKNETDHQGALSSLREIQNKNTS